MVREQDRYMPIANVIRIMRRILPSHAKISDDAKETIQECVSEYISFITSEANERCQREQRKTITAEDVLWAMGKLGFEEYLGPLSIFLNRYREFEGDRSSVRGDSLVKRSIEMAHMVSSGYGPSGPSSFRIAPHQGMLTPPITSAGHGPGYFKDAGNGSSGQSPVACYDPYAAYR
ncbi:Nuclear transcription factor Y subunit B-9 [Ranunculus cassubicifolius]